MITLADKDRRIRQLERELETAKHEHERALENVTHERDTLSTAIAEHCELFGLESFDATGLHDVARQVQRLLEGKDIDCGLEYLGITGEVEALVWLAQFAGTDGAKTKMFFARLSYPKAQQSTRVEVL